MRDIKFRGLKDDISNCSFVYGWHCINAIGEDAIQTTNSMKTNTINTVIQGTIGQYTGLKDRNGVDIYEGDIVKGNHSDNMIIESINGGLQFYSVKYYNQNYNDLIAAPTCDPQAKSWLMDSEVIGNIHENPELINN